MDPLSPSESRAATDKAGLDLVWFGQYAPHASSYIPVYAIADDVPSPFAVGSLHAYVRRRRRGLAGSLFDRYYSTVWRIFVSPNTPDEMRHRETARYDAVSSYWAHAAVGNYAARFYVHTIGALKAAQAALEGALYTAQPALEAAAAARLATGDVSGAAALVADASEAAATADVAAWHALLFELIATYKDGQIVAGPFGETLKPLKMFYPRSWLEGVGFWTAGSSAADAVEGAAYPAAAADGRAGASASAATSAATLFSICVGVLVGFAAGRRTTTTRKPKNDSGRPATEWKGSSARQSIDVTYVVPVQAAAAGSKEFSEFANERTALNA